MFVPLKINTRNVFKLTVKENYQKKMHQKKKDTKLKKITNNKRNVCPLKIITRNVFKLTRKKTIQKNHP